MKKINIGQIGIGHNHGAAKAADCKRLPDIFEFVGVVAPDVDKDYFKRKGEIFSFFSPKSPIFRQIGIPWVYF